MTNRRNIWALRTSLVLTGAIVLTACQTASPYSSDGSPQIAAPRPNFPTRVESQPAPYTPDTQIPPPEQQPPESTPPPASNIESRDLPPLQPAESPPPPQEAPPPPPPPVRAPVYEDITTGPVVTADGPAQVHVVKRGETLYSIARQMGVTVKFLTDQNNIKDPSSIRPGQRIKGPATRGKAYVVQPGDTLSAIGRRFNVSAAQIAAANNMRVNGTIQPNQKLILPSGYRDSGPQRVLVEAGTTPPAEQPPYRPTPQSAPPPPVTSSAPPVLPPATTTVGDLQTLGRGKFIWPIDGRVIGGFGARGPAQQSNGLNITAAEGTPVKAAAAGKVIYAGGDLADFGNLVLVQHDDGFVTAYAHLSRIDVTADQQIRQGDYVGLVGQTGDVTQAQLYFEMRHQNTPRDMARPFDPMLVLPAR